MRVHMAWSDPRYSSQALSHCQNSVLGRLRSFAVPLRLDMGVAAALSVLLAVAPNTSNWLEAAAPLSGRA